MPLRLEFAVAVKDLHAMIFAIGDVDPTLVVTGDIVDENVCAAGPYSGAGKGS